MIVFVFFFCCVNVKKVIDKKVMFDFILNENFLIWVEINLVFVGIVGLVYII